METQYVFFDAGTQLLNKFQSSGCFTVEELQTTKREDLFCDAYEGISIRTILLCVPARIDL
jgi:hypothetical protein